MLRLKAIEVGGASGKEAFGNEKQLRGEFDKQAKNFDEALLGFEKVQKQQCLMRQQEPQILR